MFSAHHAHPHQIQIGDFNQDEIQLIFHLPEFIQGKPGIILVTGGNPVAVSRHTAEWTFIHQTDNFHFISHFTESLKFTRGMLVAHADLHDS